jgi:hypothetical protein
MKKTIKCCLGMMMGWLSMGLSANTFAGNLIANPGFERGRGAWVYDSGTMSIDSTTFYGGSHSALIADLGGLKSLSQWVSVTGGKTYYFSTMTKFANANSAHIKLSWSTGDLSFPMYGTSGESDWVQHSNTFTAPSDATYVYIQFCIWGGLDGTNPGYFWVDDVEFSRVLEPTDVSFSLAGGTYSNAQTVTITSCTETADIYYTTDGSNPSATNGTKIASGASVVVDRNLTLRAVAVVDGTAGSIESATYTFNLVLNPGFESGSLNSWIYDSNTMSADNATFYDGLYSAVIADPGGFMSLSKLVTVTGGKNYYISAMTKLRNAGGAHIKLSWSTGDMSFPMYGTNGDSDWAQRSGIFTAPANATSVYIQFCIWGGSDGINPGYFWVDDVEFLRVLEPTDVIISLAGGIYAGAQTVTVTSSIPTADIYYTTDGSDPSMTKGTRIASGASVVVDRNLTLRAVAVVNGTAGSIESASYAIIDREFDVPGSFSIATDGDLSDWSDSSEWSGDFVLWSNATATPTSHTKAKFAYNNAIDILYVAIQTDECSVAGESGGCAVVGLSKNINGNPQLGTDATQLSFDFQSDGSVLVRNEIQTYGVGPVGKTCITTDVKAGCKESNGVWTYEIAIPLWKVWTNASQGKETLSPGDVVYVYSCMQDAYGTANGTNLSYYGNPNFYAGAFDEAAVLTLMEAEQIPGDANGDGAVDVGDLGILAANYGTTGGVIWSKGDFNGDDAVDVGDLGILAAHYGQGSNTLLNFSADYAKAFGTTVADDNTSMEETSNSVCSGLGLPLIVGLALVGLMLVKLEE